MRKQGESPLDTSMVKQGEGIEDNSRPSNKPYKMEKWGKARFTQGSFNESKTASHKEPERSRATPVHTSNEDVTKLNSHYPK